MATPVAAPAPATQGPALSRYIDPGSGDFMIDDSVGQFASMPSLRQRVLLVMNTELGSALAVPDLGIPRPKKIDETYIATTRAAVRRAFYRMTDVERIMRIESIDIERRSSGRVQVTLVYRDLSVISPTSQRVTRTF
jgi:hypothetical protein